MTRHHVDDLDPDGPIPLSLAGMVVDKGRSTMYAWVERGILVPTDSPDGMTVTPRQVREAEATVTRGRPRAKKAGQSEIESHVD